MYNNVSDNIAHCSLQKGLTPGGEGANVFYISNIPNLNFDAFSFDFGGEKQFRIIVSLGELVEHDGVFTTAVALYLHHALGGYISHGAICPATAAGVPEFSVSNCIAPVMGSGDDFCPCEKTIEFIRVDTVVFFIVIREDFKENLDKLIMLCKEEIAKVAYV